MSQYKLTPVRRVTSCPPGDLFALTFGRHEKFFLASTLRPAKTAKMNAMSNTQMVAHQGSYLDVGCAL